MSAVTRTAAGEAARPGALLDVAWWAPGLALHERGECPAGGEPEADPVFAARLADLGLPRDARLAEAPAALAARVRRPGWATLVEQVVDAARPRPREVRPATDWRAAFARIVAPFVEVAVDRIGRCDDTHVDLAAVAAGTGRALSDRLVDTAARTFVTELHRWRADGRLAGGDTRARFEDFVGQLTASAGIGEVLARYPVLARLLAQATTLTADTTVELLDRFGRDRDALVRTLLDGADPGPLVAVTCDRGDRHAGGRAVAFLDFADGSRLVYKPRDHAPYACFARILDYLSAAEPGLFPRIARALLRTGYEWAEHVSAGPAADRAAVDRFYHRQGALLALLHLLRATDVHYQNVIADGDQPVLVDIETLFHPSLVPGGTGDPAADALAASVHRTALLPLLSVGEQGMADMSGLGGGAGSSPSTVVDWSDPGTDQMRLVRRAAELTPAVNRPVLHGQPVDPGEYQPAMLAGFRRGYDVMVAHRDGLTTLLRDCADLEVRVVTRATWVYATLLDETTHPDVLRDAVDRDRALCVLYQGRTEQPLFAQFLSAELADLWAGDVPRFTASAGTGRLRTATGAPLPEALPRPGLTEALELLAGLNEVDRRDQEWVISATLATRVPAANHPEAAPFLGHLVGAAAHPDELLAAACGIADQLVASGITAGGRVNWLGLEPVEDRQWLVLPLGASLGTGYLGVALFLAELAALTGIRRYADQARAATDDLPAFVAALAARPELVAAIGCGGLQGLGGIAYGLTRLGALLDESALTDAAVAAVPLAASAATPHTELGWTGGLAGCLAAMSAVHADLGLPAAADAARRCADLLTGHPEHGDPAVTEADRPLGFTDGLDGVGWALATVGPAEHHRAVGRRLTAQTAHRETPQWAGWCRGAAGQALARAVGSASPHVLTGSVEVLAGATVRQDLSLCHGELGVTEVLAVLADTDQHSPAEHHALAARALRRRTGLVLDALRRHGASCGVPGGVRSPGLLTGLAGIGHGLLRLARPQQVPSALLLQPTAVRG